MPTRKKTHLQRSHLISGTFGGCKEYLFTRPSCSSCKLHDRFIDGISQILFWARPVLDDVTDKRQILAELTALVTRGHFSPGRTTSICHAHEVQMAQSSVARVEEEEDCLLTERERERPGPLGAHPKQAQPAVFAPPRNMRRNVRVKSVSLESTTSYFISKLALVSLPWPL